MTPDQVLNYILSNYEAIEQIKVVKEDQLVLDGNEVIISKDMLFGIMHKTSYGGFYIARFDEGKLISIYGKPVIYA